MVPFPASIHDVMAVAELGLTMPPKSTWFFPNPPATWCSDCWTGRVLRQNRRRDPRGADLALGVRRDEREHSLPSVGGFVCEVHVLAIEK